MTTPIEAAQRLGKLAETTSTVQAYGKEWASMEVGRDRNEVIAWALPLLDTTPVTDEWLRAVGFKETSDWSDGPMLGFISLDGTDVWLEDGNGGIKRACESKTRGAVRMLCAAFGYPLNERPE